MGTRTLVAKGVWTKSYIGPAADAFNPRLRDIESPKSFAATVTGCFASLCVEATGIAGSGTVIVAGESEITEYSVPK